LIARSKVVQAMAMVKEQYVAHGGKQSDLIKLASEPSPFVLDPPKESS